MLHAPAYDFQKQIQMLLSSLISYSQNFQNNHLKLCFQQGQCQGQMPGQGCDWGWQLPAKFYIAIIFLKKLMERQLLNQTKYTASIMTKADLSRIKRNDAKSRRQKGSIISKRCINWSKYKFSAGTHSILIHSTAELLKQIK